MTSQLLDIVFIWLHTVIRQARQQERVGRTYRVHVRSYWNSLRIGYRGEGESAQEWRNEFLSVSFHQRWSSHGHPHGRTCSGSFEKRTSKQRAIFSKVHNQWLLVAFVLYCLLLVAHVNTSTQVWRLFKSSMPQHPQPSQCLHPPFSPMASRW